MMFDRIAVALRFISICLLFFLILSCQKAENGALQAVRGSGALQTVRGGGVILSFDDYYTLDWYNADKVMSKYSWKATFFVSLDNPLTTEDINRLRTLQGKGHEIGSHSNNHLNAEDFISDNSLDDYFVHEVLPSLNFMKSHGFMISSFAYPFGARVRSLDNYLLEHFTMIRGTMYSKKIFPIRNNFAGGSRLVFGLGIDESYGNDIEYILGILQYAKENDKIAVFYGHRVGQEKNPPEYMTTYKTLETMCQYIVDNNMQFMTLKELAVD